MFVVLLMNINQADEEVFGVYIIMCCTCSTLIFREHCMNCRQK